MFRRTGDPGDRIVMERTITGHTRRDLTARAPNFKADRTIALGSIQYVRPNEAFPEIRVRFTPPAGLVFGHTQDPNIAAGRDVYDRARGVWDDHSDAFQFDSSTPRARLPTAPGDIFARNQAGINLGYLDDSSDGVVTVSFAVGGVSHSVSARISSGPPDYAPDSFPVRSFADELGQMAHGPMPDSVSVDETIDVVRRALETVRLMNTGVQNRSIPFWEATWGARPGPDERPFSQAAADFGHAVSRHRQVLDSLKGLRAPATSPERAAAVASIQFVGAILREFTQAADYSQMRMHAMPAMMRGGDGHMLALCRRQRNVVLKAAEQFAPRSGGDSTPVMAMQRLIEALGPGGSGVHSTVALPNGGTLADLFAETAEMLNHLATDVARGPRAGNDGLLGEKLVKAGDPEGSAFFKMLNDNTHPMRGIFLSYHDPVTEDDGIEVVRKWILDLPQADVG